MYNVGLRGLGKEAAGRFRVPERGSGWQQGYADRSPQVPTPRWLPEVLRLLKRGDTTRTRMQRRYRLQRGTAEVRRARKRPRMVRHTSFIILLLYYYVIIFIYWCMIYNINHTQSNWIVTYILIVRSFNNQQKYVI